MPVYGEEFLALVTETWGASSPTTLDNERKPYLETVWVSFESKMACWILMTKDRCDISLCSR